MRVSYEYVLFKLLVINMLIHLIKVGGIGYLAN